MLNQHVLKDTAICEAKEVQDEPLSLLDLPEELLILVLGGLDWRELCRCQRVCRALHNTVIDSAQLQYLIELGKDGLFDNPNSSLLISDKLKLLLSRRASWASLDWKRKMIVPVRGSCLAYELVGGVFAKSTSLSPLVGASLSRHLSLTWLPSRLSEGENGRSRYSEAKQVIINDLGISTRDFAIDPSQDLIALIEHDDGPAFTSPPRVHIHLRTMSTNQPHPQTTTPIFRHGTPFRVFNAFIQIVDDVVGLFFWADGPGLLIWEWKTGNVLVYTVGPGMPSNIFDFSFLSNRAYILTCIAPASILVYTFSSTSSHLPHLSGTLLMPTTLPAAHLVNFSTHTGPFLADPAYNGKPFAGRTGLEDRLYVMTAQYEVEGGRPPNQRFVLFVQGEVFERFVKAGQSGEAGKEVLEWEEWGRENTRFTKHDLPFQWLRYVHGRRVVLPQPLIAHPRRVDVIDFNVRSLANAAGNTDNSTNDTSRHAKPLVVHADKVFHQPIQTELPYRLSKRVLTSEEEDWGTEFSGFMLDEERLIGLKTTAFSEGDMGEIHVFSF